MSYIYIYNTNNTNNMDLTPLVLRKYNKQPPKQPVKQKVADDVEIDIGDKKIKYISMDLSKQFTDARIKKGLSRKQLAQDMNIKESVVNDIETGVLKHNGMMISKFKKYLGLDNV